MSARQIAGACVLGAYLLVLGFLGGVIVSAIRFDGRRAAVLSKLDDATARVRGHLHALRARRGAVRGVSG